MLGFPDGGGEQIRTVGQSEKIRLLQSIFCAPFIVATHRHHTAASLPCGAEGRLHCDRLDARVDRRIGLFQILAPRRHKPPAESADGHLMLIVQDDRGALRWREIIFLRRSLERLLDIGRQPGAELERKLNESTAHTASVTTMRSRWATSVRLRA